MLRRGSKIEAKKALRLAQLNYRLETLTQDYATFFKGFDGEHKSGAKGVGKKTVTILTELQNLRRADDASGLSSA
jgi:hypothetical protein